MKTLLLVPVLALVLQAQEAAPTASDATPALPADHDPFASNHSPLGAPSNTNLPLVDHNSPPYSLCAEYFSLPLADAATLRRENLSDTELYKKILQKLEEGTCQQENLIILRGRFGEHSTAESIVEEIYPTEYEVPNLSDPQTTSPPFVTAFETRNTGLTTEVIAKLNPDQTVSLKYAPEFVYMIEPSTWGEGTSAVKMPTFESQRVNFGLKIQLGKTALVGTINRPPQTTLAPKNGPEIWLAFVTIDLIKE